MPLGVHVLYVVEVEIRAFHRVDDDAPAHEAAGVERPVIAGPPAGVQRLEEKFRLHEGLAAGEGDAAAVAEEYLVLVELRHQLFDGVTPAAKFARLGRADVAAFAAAVAEAVVRNERAAACGDRSVRTAPDAGAAADALFAAEEHRRHHRLALGIMAPPAGERASFEMHRGARAGAVVYRIFFYVEDDSRLTQLRRFPPQIGQGLGAWQNNIYG